jgi:hypothetical protein
VENTTSCPVFGISEVIGGAIKKGFARLLFFWWERGPFPTICGTVRD